MLVTVALIKSATSSGKRAAQKLVSATAPSLRRIKRSATQRMDSQPVNDNARHPPDSAQPQRQRQLLDVLLSDAASDVEVVTRELGLRDQMCERLRRAIDRMACAQSILETIGTDCAEAGMDGEKAESRMWEAVRLLAEEWPEEYSAGAVEGVDSSFTGGA